MPESTPSASRTLVWLLAILLIGVMALYGWHNDNQMKTIAGKDADIARSAELLADSEKKMGQLQEKEQALRSEIDALTKQHDGEKQELTGKLDAAAQANQALQGEMEALKVKDTEILAAEKERASQAYAELQGRLDTAIQQITALEADMEQQKQAMAEAAAAHEARTLDIEQQLKEKIGFYRTALEGSDPERATQLVALELQVTSGQEAIQDAQQAIHTLKQKEAGLNAQLADASQVVAERDQALAETAQKLDGLQSELTQSQSALASLQQQHEAAAAQAGEMLAASQQQLEAAEAAHVKTKSDAATALQDAEARISELGSKLQAETAALLALQQKHQSTVTELQGSLDSSQQTLANVEAQLDSAKQAAVEAQRAHEKQIGEARSKMEGLEDTLAQTRQQAAADLEASKRESEETVNYVRGMYTEFSKLRGRHTDRGMLLSLAEEDLRFRISKADLPEGDLPSLDTIAALLVEHPKLTARIEGHTDSKGREETNLDLSRQRAEAVKQALVDRGVPAERMAAEGIGAARPIADNATSAGRRENRRVEIYVLEDE